MVELHEIINNDLEGFLDILSERAVGNGLLMDIAYRVVAVQDDGTLILEVDGDDSEAREDG
jgi:hypothetical protein